MTAPNYLSIVVVDIEGSSGRSNTEKPLVRRAMYDALTAGFARVGLAWDACRSEDRGDGAYVLVPAHVPKSVLAGELVAAMDRILAEPRVQGQVPWPRCRIAVHAGEVTLDREGSSGRDVDLTFALVDAEDSRRALRENASARTVLIVSDSFHSALADGVPDASALNGFDRVSVRTKARQESAWIRVPSQPTATATDTATDTAQSSPQSTVASGLAAGGVGTWPFQVVLGIPGGPSCGSGVLLPHGHVLTCAHAVPGGRESTRGISVCAGGRWSGAPGESAGIGLWSTEDDLAVLRVAEGRVPGAVPATLAEMGEACLGRRLLLPGMVPVEVAGREPGHGRVRLRRLPGGTRGEAGTVGWAWCGPGDPVVDETTGQVVGMLVGQAGWRVDETVPMLSTEAVRSLQSMAPLWSGAVEGSRGRSGPAVQPGAPSSERVSTLAFAIALSELNALSTGADRDNVIALLGYDYPDIGATARRFTDRRMDVTSLVRTCRQYPGGLDALLRVVGDFEGESRPMAEIRRLRPRLEE